MRLLADLTLRSSLILLAALAARAMLRDRSAALRHFVLAAAVAAAAIAAPLSLVMPAWDVAWPAAMRIATARGTEAARHANPGPVESRAVRNRGVAQAGHGDDDEPAAVQQPWLGLIASLVPIAWAGGTLFGATVLLTAFARLVRIASRAERVRHGPWALLADEIAAAYGMRRRVIVLHTDAPDLLATCGLFRPRVLLPAHASGWSAERVRVVLCHELAHIRRHDWAIQIGAEALRTICWFNPLIWIVCARLRRDSEQACDDMVLAAGVPSRQYAAHLLDLARLCRRPGPRWAAATPMARPSTLEGRIAAMLNPRLDRRSLSRRAAIATAALLLALTLPAAALRAGQNALRPLTGSVYDPSGAVLPGVELKLEDAGQIKWQATTDAAGHFDFPPVQNGRYVLEASLAGFKPLRHDLQLTAARDWDRAITLQVGDIRETVSVRTPRTAAPAPSAAPGPLPIKIGGNIRAPRKLQDVRPVYPKTMSDAGREGVVPIEAIIGRDGTVQSVRVLSANVHPDFTMAAVDAVRQWRFSPTLLNGVAVDVVMTVSVAFTLSE